MGGIIIALAIMILIVFVFVSYYAKKDIELAKRLIPLAIMSIGFGVIGLIDDTKKLVFKNTKGLKPAYKMIGLLTIAVTYVIYLIKIIDLGCDTYIPIFKIYITLPIWLYIPFAIFVILGTTNAINLTDGVDGLCPTISAVVITCLTVIGIIFDVKEVVVFGTIVIGICLGFLIFNMHPAKVFMGDTGSLLLRWGNCCYGFIFKNATNSNHYCLYTSIRNLIGNHASIILQKNRKSLLQNGTITSSF